MNSDSMDPPAAFSYLGLTVAYNKIDWADLYQNCKKDQRWWVMVLSNNKVRNGNDGTGNDVQGGGLYGVTVRE